jgi:hypothetical protein
MKKENKKIIQRPTAMAIVILAGGLFFIYHQSSI